MYKIKFFIRLINKLFLRIIYMDQIKIDGQYVNPYFILDVVETDNEQFIKKAFKKKAKIWHPDKISKEDSKNPIKVQNRRHHFKVLVESYEFIINKMKSIELNFSKREHITVPKSNNIKTKQIDNSTELDLFNNEFNNLHIKNPNDFGYETERIQNIKDYDDFDYKPHQLNFGNKKFNKEEFNKVFEYQQEFYNDTQELLPYHTTNDGFNAYNGNNLENNSSVSSYNGIMIVGDTFGQSGVGYYDSNYSDYKKSFQVPTNPTSELKIPPDYKHKTMTQTPLTLSESKKQLELRMSNRNINYQTGNGTKYEFKHQETLLLDKQSEDIKNKLTHDKNLILEYQELFSDQTLIKNAIQGGLICSSDYCDELNVEKRNIKTTFK